MGLGTSIVIIAIGAILRFGVTATATGLNIAAIGVILMVVGVIGALISALFLMSWSPWPYRRTVVEHHVDSVPDRSVRTRDY